MKSFRLEELNSDVVSFRRASFLAMGLLITAIGTWLMWRIFVPNGIGPLEWTLLVIFVILFSQIATGFSLALLGFLQWIVGGEYYRIMNTLPGGEKEQEIPIDTTAIVIPIFNEDVSRVFRGIENMFMALQEAGYGSHFDFFILSDSNRPARWIEEECAWIQLCKKLHAFGRIFYRKRRISSHGKSGNVADFCRRWGKKYRYMIVLDADSIMTAKTLVRLVRAMQSNPRVGIIQTMPHMVLGQTLFRRLHQFAARVYGPAFAAGSNFWHLSGGNYWGHNAIIRLQPFMEYCDLPDLPEPEPAKRHILSHDTVEAALMRKSGFDVWFAYDEEGSYEEGPPNLTENLKRDRRWCQGNLQHFWFLFAPGIELSNRLHIWLGLMAYLSSPIWLLFLILGAFDVYEKYRIASLSMLPTDPASPSQSAVQTLLILTATVLFLPKIFGWLMALPIARNFGGVLRLTISVFIEFIFSVLTAPILMFFYTKFVLMTLAGLKVKWTTQNRSEDEGISWKDAIRTYNECTLFGLVGAVATWNFLPHYFPWLIPVFAGLLLSIPLAVWSSHSSWGKWAQKKKLFLISEEEELPKELNGLNNATELLEEHPVIVGEHVHSGLLRAILDPYVNAIHVSLLRQRSRKTETTDEYLEGLREKLLEQGPESLTAEQRLVLLWDADSMIWLHEQLWTRPTAQLHKWWLFNLHYYNETIASPLRRLKD